jgi:NAD(P)-dependent dehydrogenase (short-subunit alcohol dehydrogenase family)
MGRLDGKVCVITGAKGGIGAATAELFAREGATVVGVDLDADSPGDLALACDVTDEDAVRDLYAQVRGQYGHIDVLFNNAGISPNDDASVLETGYEAWQRVQDVNLKSVFFCCKHGIAHLLENERGGSVINTASFVAVMGAATSQISYTASKGGVLAMSRELGIEFARRGVRVNALCPGRSTHRCYASCSQRTPRRPRGASSTSRWAASPGRRRSPPGCCSWPATSRRSSPPRPSSSTAASAAPTSRPSKALIQRFDSP